VGRGQWRNEWVEPNNWTPATVPGGTATFTNTGVTTVANDNGIVTIGEVFFTGTPNAQAYTINIDNPMIVNAAGIINNSTNTQTFNVSSGSSLAFQNGSSASGGLRTPVRPARPQSSTTRFCSSPTPAAPAPPISPTILKWISSLPPRLVARRLPMLLRER